MRRPASSLSPTTHFASSQESTVRGRHSSPRTFGQSRLGPREFGEDASERTAFCTIHPYSLSLHHHRYVDCAVGAACTASGGVAHAAQPVSLAHAHNSTRLRDSVRQAFHVSILLRHRPFLRFAFEGRAWQYRILPFGLSLSPRVLTKVVEGALTPLREVGVRILNYLDDWLILAQSRERQGDPRDLVLRHLSQLGQLGKEQALPCAENLFSRCGVRLGQYDGTPYRGTCPSSAELPDFLQRQECGTTETVSEAPGAYGIRSCSHAARIASYETTSALATLPGPEVGMAPRYTASGYHPAVSPLPQPLDGPCLSTGWGAPRTSVPAYCCHNRCLQHGLGRYMERAGSLGALDRAPTALAHKLPRAYLDSRGQTTKNQVRNLGVILETDLSFSSHVKAVTKSAYYHLKNIARIRCFVSSHDLEKLFMPLSPAGWIIIMVSSPAFQRRPLDSCSSSRTLLPGF